MIDVIAVFTNKVPKRRSSNFFELPSKERKKIIKRAGIAAQKDQEKMLRKYDVQFGSSKVGYVNS